MTSGLLTQLRTIAQREGRFLTAEAEDALWHFPASGAPMAHAASADLAVKLQGLSSAKRLARAIRQDLWRGMQRIRGLWPWVRIALPMNDTAEVRIGAFLPDAATARAAGRALDDFQQTCDQSGWTAYARLNDKGRGKCSRKS